MAQLRELIVRFIYQKLLPALVWFLYFMLSATWRVTLIEPASMQRRLKDRSPLILAHWHGDELALLSLIRRYRVATIASTSIDGDLMARLIGFFGGVTVRGSSTRGGISALKGLIRMLKNEGRNSSFAVDGPKGPIYKVKPGVFEVAKLVGAPIYPGGVFCDRAWVFSKSWNKTFMPKPFARVIYVWNEALPMSPKELDPHSEDLATALEEALHRARSEAAKNNFAQ